MNATLDPQTTITTAARRIARNVNASPTSTATYYDADGNGLVSIGAGTWGGSVPDEAIALIPGRRDAGARMTEREAQDHLDAHAATGQLNGYGDFLAALDFVRGVDR